MSKEYEIWYREKDGTLKRSGLGKVYTDFDQCKEWYDYLCTTWREELKEEVKKEDLSKTNWAHRIWEERKDQKWLIVVREVGPYQSLEEEK